MEKRYSLHSHQYDFINNDSRYEALISGIGGGKTHVGCIKAILTMLENPNTLGAIIAPTYRMLSDTTRRKFIELIPEGALLEFKRVS